MPNKDDALSLFDAGLIPLPAKGKSPIVSWKNVAQQKPDRPQIASWFDRDHNIWIATGSASGVVVIDCDSRDGDLWWRERLGADFLDKTTTVKTSKGYHYWFKLLPGETLQSWSATEEQRAAGVSFDIRGEGGGVIAPPSIHESGHVYTFVRDLSHLNSISVSLLAKPTAIGEIAEVPRSMLSQLLNQPPFAGGRDVWLTKVAGHLAKIVPYEDAFMGLLHTVNNSLPEPLSSIEVDKKRGVWESEKAKPDVPTSETGWLIGDGAWLYTSTITEINNQKVQGVDRWANADLRAVGLIDGPQGRSYAVDILRSDGAVRSDLIKPGMLGRNNEVSAWLAKHGVSVIAPRNESHGRTYAGARLLRYLEAQNPPAYKEVPYLGWHDGIGFVTHEGIITRDGLLPHTGVMPSPGLQNLAPFRYGMGDPEHAIAILREILTFQDPDVTAVFSAWWAATLLKGQIMSKIGHFPYFAIEAASESGKTRGFFRMMLNLSGSVRFGEWTKAATRDAIGSHRNGIVHIDDSNRLDNVADLLRQATAEGSEGKKAADNTGTVDIRLVAPVLITGESLGELGGGEKAQRDRRVLLDEVPSPVNRLSRHGDYPQWEDIKQIEKDDPDLSVYAGTMVMLALQNAEIVDEVNSLRTGAGRHHEVMAILRVGARVIAAITGEEWVVDQVDNWTMEQPDLGSENTLITRVLPWAITDEWGKVVNRNGGEPPAFVEDGLVHLHPDWLAAVWQKELRKRGKTDRLDSAEAIRAQLRAMGIKGSKSVRVGVGREAPKARYAILDNFWSQRVIQISQEGWE